MAPDDVITSAQNAHVKLLRRLAIRRHREAESLVVVEGEDLVAAAHASGIRCHVLLVDAHRRNELRDPIDTTGALSVDPALLSSVSALGHAPRIIGIFDQPRISALPTMLAARRAPWLCIDALGDPGNVGTIVRSVAAFDAGGVLCLPNTADPFSSKAVRAAMGASFRTPIATGVTVADIPSDARIVALDAHGNAPLPAVQLDAADIIVVGSERHGLSDAVRARADVVASIPQRADVDSVNAAVAASCALYEWRRGTNVAV